MTDIYSHLTRYMHAQDVAGAAIVHKFNRQADDAGIRRAACNLRKQGYPLGVCLAIVRAYPPAIIVGTMPARE